MNMNSQPESHGRVFGHYEVDEVLATGFEAAKLGAMVMLGPPEHQVEIRHGNVLQHNVGGRESGVSVVNILTTNGTWQSDEVGPDRAARATGRLLAHSNES